MVLRGPAQTNVKRGLDKMYFPHLSLTAIIKPFNEKQKKVRINKIAEMLT